MTRTSVGDSALPEPRRHTPLFGRLLPLTLMLLLASLAGSNGQAADVGERRILEGGWFDLPPYSYADEDGAPTGFDVTLLREVGRRAGISFVFRHVDWHRTQALVRDGQLDFGVAAYRTPEREAYAAFSGRYRQESDRLFLAPRVSARITSRSPEALFAELWWRGFKIGVVRGYDYGPQVAAFLRDPASEALVVKSATDRENTIRMAAGQIDGFLADRLSGYHALATSGKAMTARPVPLSVFDGDVHVLFSQRTVPPELIRHFDQALAAVMADGTYDSIRRRFVVPTMLDIAISGAWFRALDWIGTVAFAVSGVLLARREHYSIFGALVLAALPALGGGVVRDLLTGRHPIGILESAAGPLLVLGTVVTGYTLFWLYDVLAGRDPVTVEMRSFVTLWGIYEASDAIGLAAFTVTGVVIAIRTGAAPLWIWGPLLAVLTAAGGGILRDVIRSDADNPALKTSLYAELALLWGFILSWVATREDVVDEPAQLQTAIVVVLAGAFLSRMAVVGMRLRSPRF